MNKYKIMYSTNIEIEETYVFADRFERAGNTVLFWLDYAGISPENKHVCVAFFNEVNAVERIEKTILTGFLTMKEDDFPEKVAIKWGKSMHLNAELPHPDHVYLALIRDPSDDNPPPPNILELHKFVPTYFGWEFLGMVGDIPVLCITKEVANRFKVRKGDSNEV